MYRSYREEVKTVPVTRLKIIRVGILINIIIIIIIEVRTVRGIDLSSAYSIYLRNL